MLERRSGAEGRKRDSEIRTQTQKKVDTVSEALGSLPRARGPKQVSEPVLCPRALPCALVVRRIVTYNTALMGNNQARPRSETSDGDVDGDGEHPAPAGAESLASDPTPRRRRLPGRLPFLPTTFALCVRGSISL